jgi:hypothetical protein
MNIKNYLKVLFERYGVNYLLTYFCHDIEKFALYLTLL